MKKILLGALFVSAIFGSTVTAQITAKFEDGKTMSYKGTSVGPYTLYGAFEPLELEQNVQTIYRMDGDTLEVVSYGELNKKMIELSVTRLHKNQIKQSTLKIKDQDAENGRAIYYALVIDADGNDKRFNNKSYSFDDSEGREMMIYGFNVNCDTKEGLEKLLVLLKK